MTTKPDQTMVEGSLITNTAMFIADGPQEETYNVVVKSPYAFTLKSINYVTTGGDTDLTILKNGSSVGSPYAGLDFSSTSIVTTSGDVSFAANDRLSVQFTNNNAGATGNPELVHVELVMELV